ncbi:MAG TPA: alpha/beta hydrolase [Candidatus Acidoferrales bacterium]|jgi:pimeloyl-ACP methyl ester carboxylesterase|nr:alpha/beta hydrolase [Candidatus Acidoferrales bacterium]
MKIRKWAAMLSVTTVACCGISIAARAQNKATGAPPAAIHTYSTADIASTGFFYVGGQYVGAPGKEVMDGAEYVEVMVPKKIRHPYPIVFFHGAGQTGTDWLQTPDGRPGWAYYFTKLGYTVYMVDFPARGRSTFNPSSDGDGALTIRTALQLEQIWTDIGAQGNWPQAKKFSQWPGDGPNKGKMGDPIFDDFARTQVQFLQGGKQAKLNLDAHVALLDKIGSPVILITHSQGGEFGWQVADARPKLVKAIITAEPAGPPIKNVDIAKIAYSGPGSLTWGVTSLPLHYDPPVNDPAELQPVLEEKSEGPDIVPCYLQKEPAHKLVSLKDIPVLDVSTQASYHRVFDSCIAKWLMQAGVKTEYVKLEDVGIRGNEHELMLDKNSDQIAKYFADWLEKNVH